MISEYGMISEGYLGTIVSVHAPIALAWRVIKVSQYGQYQFFGGFLHFSVCFIC